MRAANAGGVVDSGTYEMPIGLYNASVIDWMTVRAGNTTAGAQPVTYYFQVQPHSRVPLGAYLVVDLPPEVGVPDSSALTRGCPAGEVRGFRSDYITCSYSTEPWRQVRINGGMRFGASELDPPVLEWEIPALRNPRSKTATSEFNVTIFDVTDVLLFYFNDTNGTGGPTVVMTSYEAPAFIEYVRDSYANGGLVEYTWTIRPTNEIKEGDRLSFTMPSPVRFSDNTTCRGTGDSSSWLPSCDDYAVSTDRQTVEVTVALVSLGRRRLASAQSSTTPATSEQEDGLELLSEGRRDLQSTWPYPCSDDAAADCIPAGANVQLILTDVTSAPTLRPAEGAVQYSAVTAEGDAVEATAAYPDHPVELEVVNKYPGDLAAKGGAGATPDYWEKNATANYNVAFEPLNYDPSMRIIVVVPHHLEKVDPDCVDGDVDGDGLADNADGLPQCERRNIGIRIPTTNTTEDGQIMEFEPTCFGVEGTDDTELTCYATVPTNYTVEPSDADGLLEGYEDPNAEPKNQTLNVTDGFHDREPPGPLRIALLIDHLQNPETDIQTASFGIETWTSDGYAIDALNASVFINFLCRFPCKTCDEDTPTNCTSCYTATTEFIYLHEEECLAECTDGLYALPDPLTPTCAPCEAPCATCGTSATQCLSCAPGWRLYEVDDTCWEVVDWAWPFVTMAAVLVGFVLVVDCCKRSTNFLHSILFFYSLLEDAVWCCCLYLYFTGSVKGSRPLSCLSFGAHVLLNLIFAVVHGKLMLAKAAPEYKQVFKEFKCSSWTVQIAAYLLNFKMSLLLVSSFAARPRFAGVFNADSWQKFNIFAVLYIILVYATFTADFYLYFTEYGLRQLASYVAIEGIVVMTVICLILLLEILGQCACAGIGEQDLGKRAGLFKDAKGGAKKKRRVRRSGMGNDEGDYGEEYDSEEDYDSELDLAVSPVEVDEEEESEEELSEYTDEDGESLYPTEEASEAGKKRRRSVLDEVPVEEGSSLAGDIQSTAGLTPGEKKRKQVESEDRTPGVRSAKSIKSKSDIKSKSIKSKSEQPDVS